MRQRCVVLAAVLLCGVNAAAQEFKAVTECTPGRRVADRQGRTGVIAAVRNGMCVLTLDKADADGRTERSSLHWMLRDAGATAGAGVPAAPPAGSGGPATAATLKVGKYACYSSAGGSTNYLFMDVHILGPDSYADRDGKKGGYALKADGGLVFTSGTFSTATARVFPGPRIGMNQDGGKFFAIMCDLKR
jgi:hypothetical protein